MCVTDRHPAGDTPDDTPEQARPLTGAERSRRWRRSKGVGPPGPLAPHGSFAAVWRHEQNPDVHGTVEDCCEELALARGELFGATCSEGRRARNRRSYRLRKLRAGEEFRPQPYELEWLDRLVGLPEGHVVAGWFVVEDGVDELEAAGLRVCSGCGCWRRSGAACGVCV